MQDVCFQRGVSVTGHFKFLPGHRRQVNNLIKKVKEEVANNTMQQFVCIIQLNYRYV